MVEFCVKSTAPVGQILRRTKRRPMSASTVINLFVPVNNEHVVSNTIVCTEQQDNVSIVR